MRLVKRVKHVKVYRVTLADGSTRTYCYHRPTGLPLPPLDDPTFLDAYQAAEAAMNPTRGNDTVSALIDQFKDSSDWRRLRDSTRAIMAINLKSVEAKFGTLPVAALADRQCRAVFLAWRDLVAEKTPRAADAKLSALQRVLSFAHDRGLIDSNPLEGFRRVYEVDRSERIWLPEQIVALNAVASPDVAFVALLAYHTGQRQGDLLRLTWTAYDGRALSLIQSKTRARVFVPLTVAAREAIDARKRTSPYIATNRGNAWTPDAFKKAWARSVTASKVDGLHFHDLRGTAVTMLAEAGCTVPEIASITGHSLRSATRILEAYLSATRALSESAIVKLENMKGRTP